MFKLLRYFSIISLIAFTIVIILLGWLYRRAAEQDLLRLQEALNVTLTQTFANSLWFDYAPFVQSAQTLTAEDLRNHPQTDSLGQAVMAQMKGSSVVKVKIYNLDGLTLFSTQASQIGEDKSDNAGFLAARNGEVASELAFRDTFSAFEGEIADRNVLSSYIPIRPEGSDDIQGVFEIYSDVTPLLQQINITQRNIFIGVAAILIALYGILFLTVYRADKIIHQQQAQNQAVEAALRQRERQYRTLVQKMSEGLIQTDAGNMVQVVNERACDILGLKADQLLNQLAPATLTARTNDTSDPDTDAITQFEAEFHKDSGETIWVRVGSTPVIDEAGQVTGSINILTDITQQKEAEATLKEARSAAESANEAKTEFVSLVSHELRTPLTSIKGYADMLTNESIGSLNEMQRRFLEPIRNNAVRMARMVADLSDLSKIESGRFSIEPESVSVAEVVRAVVQTTSKEIEERNQSLTVQLEDNLPPMWGEQTRVEQILTNLVSNAYKYTPDEGHITIRAGQMSYACNGQPEQPMIHLSVEDTGIGMKPEDQGTIFEKFTRLKDEQMQDVPGSGLGLSITRSLIEIQAGDIWFESVYGQGTTFHIVLPITNKHERQAA